MDDSTNGVEYAQYRIENSPLHKLIQDLEDKNEELDFCEADASPQTRTK